MFATPTAQHIQQLRTRPMSIVAGLGSADGIPKGGARAKRLPDWTDR